MVDRLVGIILDVLHVMKVMAKVLELIHSVNQGIITLVPLRSAGLQLLRACSQIPATLKKFSFDCLEILGVASKLVLCTLKEIAVWGSPLDLLCLIVWVCQLLLVCSHKRLFRVHSRSWY